MPSLIYVGAIGARIIIDLKNLTIPVTTAITFFLKRPDGTSTTITPPGGAMDYVTGKITYESVLGDLTVAGEYRVQVHGLFDDGDDIKSNLGTFTVYEPLS